MQSFSRACFVWFITSVCCNPIVDPGVFVIQGVSTCLQGKGYCVLGDQCDLDKDFLDDETGGHCDGLLNAFTPKISFVCCKYNPGAKLTSEFPTTTQSAFTITHIFDVLDQHPDYSEDDELFPADVDPESLIDIVEVLTDRTEVIGFITRPFTGIIPTRPPTTPLPPPNITKPMTPSPSTNKRKLPATTTPMTSEVTGISLSISEPTTLGSSETTIPPTVPPISTAPKEQTTTSHLSVPNDPESHTILNESKTSPVPPTTFADSPINDIIENNID